MTYQKAVFFISNELFQLNIPKSSHAHAVIYDNAIEACDVLTEKELKEFIAEWVEYLPHRYFLPNTRLT